MPVDVESLRGILNPRAAQEQLAFSWHPPAADLACVVKRHWAVRWDFRGREAFLQEVLPHPCANLCFEPGGASVHGVITRRASHLLEGKGMTVGTMFRPGAFASFTTVPMAELADRGVPLAAVFGADGTSLELEVGARAGALARIEAIEAFLRARWSSPDPAAQRAEQIIAWMLEAPVGTRATDVAALHGLSTRALQRLFHRYVGAGPKWVLQRYRLHEAADRIAAGDRGGWAEVATDLGYADQAHFIRDFHALVGCTPGAYEAACV